MRITILGGSGLIGTALTKHLKATHQVKAFGRQAFNSHENLMKALHDTDAVIHLSGANIGQRWSKTYKQELWDSRIQTTRMLGEAIHKMETPPARVIVASAIGFYPQSQCNHPFDENQTEPGTGFLADLSVAWEHEANRILPQEKTVITRFGVVLDKHQGALAKMLPAFRFGLGGPVAGGKQCFSWIHIKDLVNAMEFLLQRPQLHGAFNLCAPTPLPQKSFAKTLAEVLHRPCFMPLPEWQLKLIFGEGSQVLTHSSAVLPQKLLELGFEFDYPTAKAALQNLLKPDTISENAE